LKQHKPCFDEVSRLLDQRKQAKIQWLRDPNQSNVDNLNNVSRDASRHFSKEKKENLRAKMMNMKITLRSKISGTF